MKNNIKIFKEIGVYDCPCRPYLNGENYCNKCQEAIIKEINEYGFARLEEMK